MSERGVIGNVEKVRVKTKERKKSKINILEEKQLEILNQLSEKIIKREWWHYEEIGKCK